MSPFKICIHDDLKQQLYFSNDYFEKALLCCLVFEKNGVPKSEMRSNFHLNEENKLRSMMQEAGFTGILCWH